MVKLSRVGVLLAVMVLAVVTPGGAVTAQQPSKGDIARATGKLFESVQNNNISGVRTAIAIGANTTATNEWGMTATDLAVEKGYFDIAHFLLSVRNMRVSAPKQTQVKPLNQAPPVKPAVKAPPTVTYRKIIPLKSTPSITDKLPAAWPAGKPNPFDPNTRVVGSSLAIIGKINGPQPRSVAPLKALNGFPTAAAEKSVFAAPPTKPVNITNAPKPSVTSPQKPGFFSRMLDSVIPGLGPDSGPDSGNDKTATEVSPTTDAVDVQSSVPASPAVKSKPSVKSERVGIRTLRPSVTAKPMDKPKLPDRTVAPPTNEAGTTKVAAKATPESMNKAVAKADPAPIKSNPIATHEPVKIRQPRPLTVVKLATKPKLTKQKIAPKPKRLESQGSNTGVFDKLSNFLRSDKPEPKLSVAKATVKPATPSIPPVKPIKVAVQPANYLSGVELTIGQSVKLGQLLHPNKMSLVKTSRVLKPADNCIEKKHGTLVFCIESVDWPKSMSPYFLVNSVIYQGTKTVVRYDDGIATSFHTIFPSQSFRTVVSYYRRILGPPSNIWKRSIAPLASPRRGNPTYIWKSVNHLTKQITTLEIRRFDDARGGFPDTKNGVILLYDDSSLPIFPQLSTVELMLINSNDKMK